MSKTNKKPTKPVSSTPPVREGDLIELTCISIGKKGDGIFKHEKFVIAVPNTIVGKTYNLRITRVLPTIGFAEVVEDDE